jgi:uncharacterized tellurite resistance protein B-like protein
MISALKALFETTGRETDEELTNRTNLAAAALMIETARADFSQDPEEELALQKLLASSLQLEPGRVETLMQEAGDRVDESTSLYEFTRVINDHYSAQQKLALVDAMWKVAFADGNLDKYEEHLIRQVAELTYVPHGDYIRSKLAAGEN